MSTQSARGAPLRGYRRRKTSLNLDLNSAPPGENRDQGGPSAQDSQPTQQGNVEIPAAIDVEAIDDDVVIMSSPSAFAAAKNNRRNPPRVVVDVDSEECNRGAQNNQRRRRNSHNPNIINCEVYINLENSGNARKSPAVEPVPVQPPPPPKEPTFSCPICMGQMVDEMSTKCGHIFCKVCIKAAISAQGKCPTCRKKVTAKELIRVFLPTSCM